MNIGIIDAEIVNKSKHRFPNLACMKISAYHKSLGDNVVLKTDYDNLSEFDKVYISKVFIKTEIPNEPKDKTNKNEDTIIEWYANNTFLQQPNIEYGGTGFYYDKSPPLPSYIEHIMPDYHLYDNWVQERIDNGCKRSEFTYYLDYSIGYLTRKCFRGCYFCVNRNYRGVEVASNLNEFMDNTRPKLCFLDDNFFGCAHWKELMQPVIQSGKRFQFKQGLDERLLDVEKITAISQWKYDGEVIFAFDQIKDKELITKKLQLIRNTVPDWTRELKFYVFCGSDPEGKYDSNFFHKDITSIFERIKILNQYNAKPYIMRHEDVYSTKYSSFYAAVSAWCNQPNMFYTCSFETFAKIRGMRKNGYKLYKRNIEQYLKDIGVKGSEWRAMEQVQHDFPDIAEKYFNIQGKRAK